MKILSYSVIAAIVVLVGCFLSSLIRTKKTRTLLILPLSILLLFIALFVGAGISRNHLKKELTVLQNESHTRHHLDDTRLKDLESRNRDISRIIGRDEKVEKWIEVLRTQ